MMRSSISIELHRLNLSSEDKNIDTISASGTERSDQITAGPTVQPNGLANGHIPQASTSPVAYPQSGVITRLSTKQSLGEDAQKRIPVIPNENPLGYLDVIAVVFNKMVGTGIFTTAGSILRLTGSKRTSLILWAVGGVYTSLW